MIKIGIIEDDQFVRDELMNVLSSSAIFQPVLSAESAENFLKYCGTQPDVRFVLVDIRLPGISGIEAIPKIKRKIPNAEIIIITSFKDNDNIFSALRAGASGYLLKDSELHEIENILSNIDKGIPALSPAIARRMIKFFNLKKATVKKTHLTEKESEVLKLLVDGLSYKLIANQIGFTINAVRYHVKNIYKKLHIHSRSELTKMYLNGEINFEEEEA